MLMVRPRYDEFRLHMDALMQVALEAADAGAAVARILRLEGNELFAGPQRVRLDGSSRVFLVALGKAAPAMAWAAAAALGDRLTAGVATIPAGLPYATSSRAPSIVPPGVKAFTCGHPLPNEGSLAAGEAALALLSTAVHADLLLALISGGGSAMIELPMPGISLGDLRVLNDLLLRSGAPIQAVNTIRRTLSRIKGGGLARIAAPARTVALILSDVVGNRLSAVASGPTVLQRRDALTAREALEAYGLWRQVPSSVRRALAGAPVSGGAVRHRQQSCPRPINLLVGSNRQVVEAVAHKAKDQGFIPRVILRQMEGEAREVGRRFAARLRRSLRPSCLLMGGETTVTVLGRGRGGRNQELALAAAQAIEGVPGVAVMALATDGVDGPTDAAGGVITGETMHEIRALALDPEAALLNNDAYPVLEAVGALLRTGPTGTNLNDLVVGLVYP